MGIYLCMYELLEIHLTEIAVQRGHPKFKDVKKTR